MTTGTNEPPSFCYLPFGFLEKNGHFNMKFGSKVSKVQSRIVTSGIEFGFVLTICPKKNSLIT